jgi:SAM-dependent methyltransferase
MADPSAGDLIPGECPLCSNQKVKPLSFRYDFMGRFLYGVSCTSCRLVYVHPQPSDSEIEEMYSEEYFTECDESQGAHGTRAYMELASEGKKERENAAKRFDQNLRKYQEGKGDFLEIGCGPGFFLAELQRLGWATRGLELSQYAVDYARNELGLDVCCDNIKSGAFPDNSFDVVYLGDVLEHLPDPIGSLRQIHAWLKSGGLIVIAVPSTMNLLSAKMGMFLYNKLNRMKTLKIPPYHLFEYTPTTLPLVLETAGFKALRLRQSAVPIKKMGLRGSPIENIGKVSLQVIAHLTSSLFNRGGDRLFAIAKKP